jgi:hypothetical protein
VGTFREIGQPALRLKTPEQLREIFKVKTAFGGGHVRQ